MSFFWLRRRLYSLIELRNKKFYFIKTLFDILLFLFYLPMFNFRTPIFKAIYIGLVFIITGLLPRWIDSNYQFWRISRLSESLSRKIVSIGIINIVWITLMGATVTFSIFAVNSFPFKNAFILEEVRIVKNPELFEFAKFLLSKLIEGIFILGSVLAASMSILWMGQMWWGSSKIAPEEKYKFTRLSAVKMVVAYFVIILNLFLWMGIPLYRILEALSGQFVFPDKKLYIYMP